MTLPPVEQCVAEVLAGGCHLKRLDMGFAWSIRDSGGRNNVEFLEVFRVAEIAAEGWRGWCTARTAVGGAGITKCVVVGCCELDCERQA
jgi:hypothetical protein